MRKSSTFAGMKTMNKLYTAKELAEILKINPQTIYRLAERGEIESYKIGKSVRFRMPTERTKQCLKKEQE